MSDFYETLHDCLAMKLLIVFLRGQNKIHWTKWHTFTIFAGADKVLRTVKPSSMFMDDNKKLSSCKKILLEIKSLIESKSYHTDANELNEAFIAQSEPLFNCYNYVWQERCVNVYNRILLLLHICETGTVKSVLVTDIGQIKEPSPIIADFEYDTMHVTRRMLVVEHEPHTPGPGCDSCTHIIDAKKGFYTMSSDEVKRALETLNKYSFGEKYCSSITVLYKLLISYDWKSCKSDLLVQVLERLSLTLRTISLRQILRDGNHRYSFCCLLHVILDLKLKHRSKVLEEVRRILENILWFQMHEKTVSTEILRLNPDVVIELERLPENMNRMTWVQWMVKFYKYSSYERMKKALDITTCAICLDDLPREGEVALLSGCNHLYCYGCIKRLPKP